MLTQINQDTAIVWVCSPNNPTGVYINDEKLQSFFFLKKVPKKMY